MSELNFPTNPNNGDEHLDYVFNSTTNTWNLLGQIDLDSVLDTEISSLQSGDFLSYDSELKKWVNSNSRAVPVGSVFPHTSVMIPPGYMACNGSTLSQSEYPELYSVIGSSYNVGGEPSGTFRLPTLTARIPVGLNSSDTSFTPLGKYGGAEDHLLTIDELPTHTHTQNSHTHSQNAHNHTQSAHSHTITFSFGAPGGSWGYGFFGSFRNRPGITGGWGLGTSSAQPAINGTAAINQDTRAANLETGGNQPHNNLQPYTTLNYIIKV
jgi:microcystin-dependent protein